MAAYTQHTIVRDAPAVVARRRKLLSKAERQHSYAVYRQGRPRHIVRRQVSRNAWKFDAAVIAGMWFGVVILMLWAV